MHELFGEHLPTTVVGALAVCLGLIFLLVERPTRATVGVADAWACAGLALITAPLLVDQVSREDPGLFARLQVVFEAGTLASSSLYVSGLLVTAQASRRGRAVVTTAVRCGYGLAVVLVVLGVAFPAERLNDYFTGVADAGATSRPGFWIFAGFYSAVVVVYTIGWGTLARQRVDPGERVRAISYAVAVPLLSASTVLPLSAAIWTFTGAMLSMLFGMFRYYAVQGARSAFLGRFLSPRVAEIARIEGLDTLVQPAEVELTAVACDLRGFTAYAEAVPSQAVIDLLREYYDAVGEAAAELDATVKDYAGDGILLLVGAPLPRTDHAAAGLALARRIIEVGQQVTGHWGTGPHPLGIGVGVASGQVTVGAIGSTGRMEYTAVGTPVNLAARLCSAATDGEVLVDQRTIDLAGHDAAEQRGELQLKGLSSLLPVYALSSLS